MTDEDTSKHELNTLCLTELTMLIVTMVIPTIFDLHRPESVLNSFVTFCSDKVLVLLLMI